MAVSQKEKRCCLYCMYSQEAYGDQQIILICANRSGYQGLWYVVGKGDPTTGLGTGVCARFRQAVDAAVLPDGVRAVPLTQGRFALVDAADYAAVIQYSWCLSKTGKRDRVSSQSGDQETWYAVRRKQGRTIRMHRQIMAAGPGQVVDHINHNGLDNRRSAKWRAYISHAGQGHYLGLFESETAAAKAYNARARELFGKFAYLNDV